MITFLLLCTLSAIIIGMTCAFFISILLKDLSIVDIAWGLGFILVAILSHLLGIISSRTTLVTALVIIWGIRLSLQIALRKIGKPEDPRYTILKSSKGLMNIYFSIFMTQACALIIIAYSIVHVHAFDTQSSLTFLDVIGLLVWGLGFFFEAIADAQLYLFLKKSQNKGKILTTGLWHYSRHPNYFGEICVWWGIFLIALNTPYGFICIISPLLITCLLLFVSGIPPAEAQLENNPEFQLYKQKTSILIPWIPKR